MANNDTIEIGVIDYGVNNLKSVCRAFEKVGRVPRVIDSPEAVTAARCLVLPGIGAFEDGMEGLRRRSLETVLKEKVRSGTPLLGICLGMQMLFSRSEEFGLHEGLDLIKGRVVPLAPPSEVCIPGYKVPHMGWNTLIPARGPEDPRGTILGALDGAGDVYFVHSFHAEPENPEVVLATTEHGGRTVTAAVMQGNVTGTQFHPEKSGEKGLKMLLNFCKQNGF